MGIKELLLKAVERDLLRMLDVQLAFMIDGPKKHPAVVLAAAKLSFAISKGNTCLLLSDLNPKKDIENKDIWTEIYEEVGYPFCWEKILLTSSSVSRGDFLAPLILSDNRLYTNRMWHYEKNVAEFFNKKNYLTEMDKSKFIPILNDLFTQDQDKSSSTVDYQKAAAAVAVTHRISVISGGPGTGKTTTAVKILIALVYSNFSEDIKIQLAAPTGRAASRLIEAFRSNLHNVRLVSKLSYKKKRF